MPPVERINSEPSGAYRQEVVASLHGVSRYFNGPHFVRALSNASFEVGRGEVFGLLGPGGSGKSTTLRILAGRLSPSEGKARVFGRPPRRHTVRMRLGYLPGKAVPGHSHVFTRVLRLASELFARRKALPASEPTSALPSNRRLLLVKQLLLKNPELLLLDEPFSDLDAAACAEMSRLITGSAQAGNTVILSSQSLAGAKEVCQRMALYYASHIEAVGTLEEILALPEAIRLTGPVLPQETAQQVLRAIREALGHAAPAGPASARSPRSSSPEGRPAAGSQKPAPAITADEVLAPLLGSGPTPASSRVGEQSVSLVDHERLAALTKNTQDSTGP